MKKGVKGVWDKYKYAALALLIGVILMLWPSRTAGGSVSEAGRTAAEFPADSNSTGANPAARDIREIQREMEEALGHISGVGRVRVLLTEENDGERILAEDITESARGGEEFSRSSETVFGGAGGGTEQAIVTRTKRPEYRGALIVCEGGDRASVRLAVTRSVAALTGLSAGRIAVEKWEEGRQ